MVVSYRTAIYIVQFIFFVPALGVTLWLMLRQGRQAASATWRFILFLSLLRIAGDIAYLVTLNHPSNAGETAVLVCNLMGLAPLSLCTLGLLGRVNEIVHVLPPQSFFLISILSLAGLITGIVGADSSINSTSDGSVAYHANAAFTAALGIFIAVIGLVLLAYVITLWYSKDKEARSALGRQYYVLVGIGCALPFILIRVIYASIADFGHDPAFDYSTGSPTLYLCLGVLTEIFSIAICLMTGYLVPPHQK